MVLRVNQVAAEFRKVSNKQMADTTKRTIRENVSIHAQLSKMSDKTMELIQENEEQQAKEKKQKQQLDMLENNEKELAKKNHNNQKVASLGWNRIFSFCNLFRVIVVAWYFSQLHAKQLVTSKDETTPSGCRKLNTFLLMLNICQKSH